MYAPYDPFALLGLPVTAELAEVKKVFRQLAKQHHPDLHPNDSGAVARFQELHRAYEMIVNLKSNPQYGQYPPYQPYPPYGGYPPYYQPYPPQTAGNGQTNRANNTNTAETEFQAYAWEPIKHEEVRPQTAPPPKAPPKEEIVQEPVEKKSSIPWREDMVEVAYAESVRDAKDRVLRKKFNPEEQLSQEIMIYLLRGKTKMPVRYSNNNKSQKDAK